MSGQLDDSISRSYFLPNIAREARNARTCGVPYRWGFIIYRTAYDDQELWDQYLICIREAIMRALEPWNDPLGQNSWDYSEDEQIASADVKASFEIVTKEDQATLDGKTIDEVREIFASWVASFPDEEKGGHHDPRYNYFLYVDKEVLEMFSEVHFDLKMTEEPDYLDFEMFVVAVEAQLINWDGTVSDKSDESRRAYKRWQYVLLEAIPKLYDDSMRGAEVWFQEFKYPPSAKRLFI
ncbi:hypothetical protein F4804DRAFT_54463 [Jackrogersella minutella]|nr:hypothetical protein F4804DRAFT_54463 [Jackrogersella minutella]